MEFPRRKTKPIKIGDIVVGGGAPIAVQSMTKTDTRDINATVNQIKKLAAVGCEIVRVAVPDREAADALAKIRSRIALPLIADIHFDHRLALAALAKGVDGLRINPGNIGSREKIAAVVKAAGEREIPIRIGVNAGSLEKDLLKKYQGATPEAMVESALSHVRILEDLDFNLIKISLKASDIDRTVKASQMLADKVDYPFHAGITEAGTLLSGTIKSSAGLTLLLRQGLADTIRVSLTAPPELEVKAAYLLLAGLGLRVHGPNIISCPICGRCEVDLPPIVEKIEQDLYDLKKPLTIAVMGCMVNGPGEAKDADIGIACGSGKGVIFKQGKLWRRVKEEEIVPQFVQAVLAMEKDE